MCSNVCILQDSFYVTATKRLLVPRVHLNGLDGFLTYIQCYNFSSNDTTAILICEYIIERGVPLTGMPTDS